MRAIILVGFLSMLVPFAVTGHIEPGPRHGDACVSGREDDGAEADRSFATDQVGPADMIGYGEAAASGDGEPDRSEPASGSDLPAYCEASCGGSAYESVCTAWSNDGTDSQLVSRAETGAAAY